MNHYEVITKLIGPIQPTGCHGEDARRLENLKKTTELIDLLVADVREAALSVGREEASMKAIGKLAEAFVAEIQEA